MLHNQSPCATTSERFSPDGKYLLKGLIPSYEQSPLWVVSGRYDRSAIGQQETPAGGRSQRVQWAISRAVLEQNHILRSYRHPTDRDNKVKPANDFKENNMRQIVFFDKPSFYTELKKALDAKEELQIVTSYRNYGELPDKLKEIFELEKHKSGKWIDFVSGSFILGVAPTPVGLNCVPLCVVAGAVVGAGVGTMVGGPVGTAVGTGVGTLVGIATAAMSSEKHTVEVEITAERTLRFKVKPK